MKLRNKRIILIFIVIIICMIASLFFTISRTRGILRDNFENNHRVVSSMISNAIDNSFLRPITVAETMSKEVTMSELMSKETREEAEAVEAQATSYFDSIRDGFGYAMIYAVSDISKAYYTYDGISRFVDPEIDERDIWYKNFIEAGVPYKLDVDTDEVNDWALSVFVNTAVYSDENKLIGVCGVGVDMTELQNQLEHFERIYDVKIDLIDKTGLIQVDTDVSKIEKEYIDVIDLSDYADGECYYEINDDGNQTITYMENLNWYLVVRDNQEMNQRISMIIIPSVISFLIGLILIILILRFVKED